MLGDILFNLRCALDHMIVQLALKNVGGRPEPEWRIARLQFPIESDKAGFDRRCVNNGKRDMQAWLADLAEEDQEIIREWQTYREQPVGVVLSVLRDLSNFDRHRFGTPVSIPPTSLAGIAPGHIVWNIIDMTVRMRIKKAMPKVELGAELFSAVLPGAPETNMEMAGYITPQIALEHWGPIVPAADRMILAVHPILSKFESHP